ncbi:hypothetical protein [Moorena producens]|uniref:hypothetical protein n=1 Tax=Moorena producens TaxID=1155739 RepID=UPI0013149600|nr:hypothetical protein [Moorena producens]
MQSASGGNPQDRAESLVEVFRLVVEGVKGFGTILGNDGFFEHLMSLTCQGLQY